MSRGKIIAAVVAVLVIGAVVAGVVVSAQNAAPLVSTARVTSKTLGVTVTASGKVEAGQKADVFPPTTGILATVDVSDGATVTAGQTLATLDADAARLSVTQAEAGLKAAKAQLEQARRATPASIDSQAAAAAVTAAQKAYNAAVDAANAYAAFKPSVKSSPDATYSALLVSRENANAGLLNAKAGQTKLTTNSNQSASIAAAQAGVDQAEASLKLARDNVAKTTIHAPMAGVVIFNPIGTPGADGSFPKAAVGAAVSPAAAPFTIVAFGTLNFNAQVDEADVDRVKVGMLGKVRLDAFPNDSIEAKVVTVKSAAVQTATGGIAFPVLLSMNGGEKNLLLGMSGSVDIEVSAVPDAVSVPIEAIFDENGQKYVFVVADGKVTKTKVETGAMTDVEAQIISGVSPGTDVAIGNLNALKSGQTVRVK